MRENQKMEMNRIIAGTETADRCSRVIEVHYKEEKRKRRLKLKRQCFIFSSRIMKTETKTILLTLNELKRNKIRAFDQNEFLHDGNRFRGYADLSST